MILTGALNEAGDTRAPALAGVLTMSRQKNSRAKPLHRPVRRGILSLVAAQQVTKFIRGSNSVVECLVANENVAGSIPVSRSKCQQASRTRFGWLDYERTHMQTPVLETKRLHLRPLRETDAVHIQSIFPQYDLVKYLANVPWPYPSNGAAEFLKRIVPEMDRGDRYGWAISLKSRGDDQLIGMIDLIPSNPDDNRGFWLGLDYHGLGYMTEAVAAVNDFAFEVLRLSRLMLNNAEPNVASNRLKEKSGATIIEVVDDSPYAGGTFKKVRWILTREQWHANRDKFAVRATILSKTSVFSVVKVPNTERLNSAGLSAIPDSDIPVICDLGAFRG